MQKRRRNGGREEEQEGEKDGRQQVNRAWTTARKAPYLDECEAVARKP